MLVEHLARWFRSSALLAWLVFEDLLASRRPARIVTTSVQQAQQRARIVTVTKYVPGKLARVPPSHTSPRCAAAAVTASWSTASAMMSPTSSAANARSNSVTCSQLDSKVDHQRSPAAAG